MSRCFCLTPRCDIELVRSIGYDPRRTLTFVRVLRGGSQPGYRAGRPLPISPETANGRNKRYQTSNQAADYGFRNRT